MWVEGKVPSKWSKAIIVSIYKKGDASNMDNYRPISLTEVLVKVLAKVMIKRVNKAMEEDERFRVEQAGFRQREECPAQVAALLEIVKRRALISDAPTICLFVDFRKAYDTVPHSALFHKLHCLGVTGRSLDFLKGLYASLGSFAKVAGALSDLISITKGLRQGGSESPIAFDCFINDLAKELSFATEGVEVPGLGESLYSLLFADDLVSLCENLDEVQVAAEAIQQWAVNWGMEIGVSKCGILVVNGPGLHAQAEERDIYFDRASGQPIPVVTEYPYLGCMLDGNCHKSMKAHCDYRIQCFRKTVKGVLQPFYSTHGIPVWLRLTVLKTVSIPSLMWGREVLDLREDGVKGLDRALGETLKKLVGTFDSNNTIYCLRTLRFELGIKSAHEMAVRGRARALRKFPRLKTSIKILMDNPQGRGRHAWYRSSRHWLSTQLGGGFWDLSKKQAEQRISQYFVDKYSASPTIALEYYLESDFKATRWYLKHAAVFPDLANGVKWLLRARVSGIWTVAAAVRRGLIDRERRGTCAACNQRLDGASEISHIVLHCPRFNEDRVLINPLIVQLGQRVGGEDDKMVTLLFGGSTGQGRQRYGLGKRWAGRSAREQRKWEETHPGVVEEPHFKNVARFCGLVFQKYMQYLWEPER